MRRLVGLLTLVLAAVAVPATSTATLSAATAAATPVHTLQVVGGDGAAMYPAFAAGTPRYGVTTTAATGGSLTVRATTDDPAGRVLVDGRPTHGPTTTVDGLVSGEEVSVQFDDAGGRRSYQLIYLPAHFPTLDATEDAPGREPGLVALTLSKWDGASPNFETVVDRNGVPVAVHEATTIGLDLKRQPNGVVSVSRPVSTTPGASYQTVLLDDALQPTGTTLRTVGLASTDGHDSVVQPDGRSLLLAYEPNARTGKLDSVIQELDPSGHLVWQWDTSGVADETVAGADPDYSHVNSVQEVGDGDVVASFRHLSSVYRIATRAHDGYSAGDVIWKLGGRDSSFRFVDDPYGGPCAQHTATLLPDNHVLVFDNGTNGFCVDPADPTGPTVNRGHSRAAEYALDRDAGTATLVWSYEPSGYNTFFAGSAERLPGGNTLLGWAPAPQAVATEVDPSGRRTWQLTARPDTDGKRYFSYRAAKLTLADIVPPEAAVASPAPGAEYAQGASVPADYTCTDRGGSGLQDCAGDRAVGAALDTSTPGIHSFTVTATDGAGRRTQVARTYRVLAAVPPARYRTDALVRSSTTNAWSGNNGYTGGPTLRRDLRRAGQRATAWIGLQNDGNRTDDLSLLGTGPSRDFSVRYLRGSQDVTTAVRRGSWHVRLAPGQVAALHVVVTRTSRARVGTTRTFTATVSSRTGGTDRVALAVRAVRR